MYHKMIKIIYESEVGEQTQMENIVANNKKGFISTSQGEVQMSRLRSRGYNMHSYKAFNKYSASRNNIL